MTAPDESTPDESTAGAVAAGAEEPITAPQASGGAPPAVRAAPATSQARPGTRTSRIRAAALAVAAAGVVMGASHVDGSVQLTPPNERAGLPVASDVLVDSAVLVCPGQQRVGTLGMRDVPGAVQVTAAAAPATAMAGLPTPATDSGLVSLSTPSGGTPVSTSERFRTSSIEGKGSTYVMARGTGTLAPGVAATQGWVRTQDDDRGLAVTPCTRPTAEAWLVGGGGGASRTERVVIANPGANAVTVRLEVLGAKGRVASPGNTTMSVAPQSRRTVSLDAIAPDEPRPAVHVVATGGVVAAVLNDAWIDGATARGVDDAIGGAAPARDLVVAGVEAAPAGQGETILRLINPGSTEALARVVVLSTAGPIQPPGLRAVRVPAGATLDVPLTLAAGSTGLHITSEQDLSAGVLVERRQATGTDREGDFGWAPAMPALSATGGAVIPALGRSDATRTLHLAAGPTGGTVTTTFGSGAGERTVVTTLAPESSAVLPFGAADRVWVSTTATDIRATATLAFTPGGVPYYSVVPIPSAPTTQTSVPVRHVAG